MKISERVKELRGEETVPIFIEPELPLETPPETPGPDYAFPISSEEVYDMNAIKIPEYQLIRRLDTNDILTINSQRYSIKTHVEVVDTAEEAMKEFEELKNPERRVCLIRNGARLLIIYTFPNIKIEIDEGNPVELQLVLNNSYDRTSRLGTVLGAGRNNTRYYITGREFDTFRKKHYEGLSLKEMKDQIQTAVEKFALLEKTLVDWSKQKLSIDAGLEMIKKAKLPEKYEELVVERWKLSSVLSKFKLYDIGCTIIREISSSVERQEVLGTSFVKILFR